MMPKFLSALLVSSALATTACADAKPETTTQTEAAATAAPQVPAVDGFTAPDEAWRTVDPKNLWVLDTDKGTVYVELFPEIAPIHVERIKTLTGMKFYDYLKFHRVMDGFMNQTGDPKGDGTGDSDLPDIDAEFTFRRPVEMPIALVDSRPMDPRNPRSGEVGVGFYNGLPVATKPTSQAMITDDGMVEAWGLHCPGVTSMARTSDPNSANSQIFLMRGTSAQLDRAYSIWGNTVWGKETLYKIKIGTVGQNEGFVPDRIKSARIMADLPASEQKTVQVLKTDGSDFTRFIARQKTAAGTYPDICDIEIPTRLKP